jgi:adenosylmethionine-8-amino-7-oxononanoate aminotransferase
MRKTAQHLASLDQQYVWHPFTQMREWMEREPVVIVRGRKARLWDARGKSYLDANSSIWTNLHGHNHPALNRAIQRQLKKIAHSSALGLANEPAALLAERLVKAAELPNSSEHRLKKIFFSDNGSTAMEVALKLSYEYWRRNGVQQPRFLSLEGAYHGDTVGAVSLGHIDLFHKAYQHLLFSTETVMAPYCYRCPFNRAAPERTDARCSRKCNWECTALVEQKFSLANKEGRRITGFSVEPLIQGAAGFIPQPEGWLERVAQIARAWRAHLIADEVMTAFGRTTLPLKPGDSHSAALFACQSRGVTPDFISVAKGLSGGYLPLAATLTTQEVFDAFLGSYEEFKTFFHGHSFTGNQLGSAAAIASLDLLQSKESQRQRLALNSALSAELNGLWDLPNVGDIRQIGVVAGIELVRNWQTREGFPLGERAGIRVCEAMARRGVLTRPIGNVIVVMPPYCTTPSQVRKIISALHDSIQETFGGKAL